VVVLHNTKGTIRKKDLIRDIFELLSKNVVTARSETSPRK